MLLRGAVQDEHRGIHRAAGEKLVFLGIDVGASATKGLLLDRQQSILSHHVRDSGVDFRTAAEAAKSECLKAAGATDEALEATLATGYGRKSVRFADYTKTEISCHARGAFFYYPSGCTIVDIGGQDSKVIKVDDKGKPVSFKMNRKCAAGTGAFLEEIAARISVPLGELDAMARRAKSEVELGSFCTVFTKTEILARIAEGTSPEDLARGVYGSVLKRIIEMDPLTDDVVMTGGVVAHNPYLVDMFEQKLGRKPFIPPLPQFTGALGASLIASEMTGE
jgi:predicted CoA-substrate-specific enzyme activase